MVESLWWERFVKEVGFEPGAKRHDAMDGESGDGENCEVGCTETDESVKENDLDQQCCKKYFIVSWLIIDIRL